MKHFTDVCRRTSVTSCLHLEFSLCFDLVVFRRLDYTSIYIGVSHITVTHNSSFTHLFTLIKMWYISSEVENQHLTFCLTPHSAWFLFGVLFFFFNSYFFKKKSLSRFSYSYLYFLVLYIVRNDGMLKYTIHIKAIK